MEAEPIAEIMKSLKKRYDENKSGWRIMAGRDPRGRYDMFISHGKTLWQIKMEMIKPYKYVGYGGRIEGIDSSIKQKMEIGTPFIFELISPQADGSLIIARGLERFSSASLSSLKHLLSPKQRELEIKLSEEIDKLIYRRYPEFLMYT